MTKQKVKKFVKDHKKEIVLGTIGLAAGILGGAALMSKYEIYDKTTNMAIGWKPEPTITYNTTFIRHIGRPGNVVRDTTTGTIYATQTDAAKALGVSNARMSKHVNGQRAHIAGHKFERLTAA